LEKAEKQPGVFKAWNIYYIILLAMCTVGKEFPNHIPLNPKDTSPNPNASFCMRTQLGVCRNSPTSEKMMHLLLGAELLIQYLRLAAANTNPREEQTTYPLRTCSLLLFLLIIP
jgi:hypothetical protein